MVSHDLPIRDWKLDAASRELVHAGRRLRLAEKPFRVLEALLAARGEVVTRAELHKLLWSQDTFVDFDNNLNSAVATLRQALGDTARAPKYIETIPKVGYRLRSPLASHPVPRAGLRAAPLLHLGLGAAVLAAAALALWSLPGRRLPPARPAASKPAAIAAFQRGVYLRGQYLATHQQPERLEQARAAFAEARRIDPAFAAAAGEEAETLLEMSFAGTIPFRDGLVQARQAAQRALERAPSQTAGARVLGVTALFLDWDLRAARGWIDRAAAGPGEARTWLARATWLAATGQPAAAAEAAAAAVALDPAAYYVRADLAFFLLAAGRDAEAAESAEQVLQAAPGFLPARAWAVAAYERQGRWPLAARHARELMRSSGASPSALAALEREDGRGVVRLWRRWDLARVEGQAAGRPGAFALDLALRHAALGDHAAAVGALREALARRHPLLVLVRAYPELAALHGDPGFEQVARSVAAS